MFNEILHVPYSVDTLDAIWFNICNCSALFKSYMTSLAIVFQSDTSNISEESTIINSLFCNIMFLATHTKTFLHGTTCILGWFPTCVTNMGVSYSHMKLITPNSVISMPYIFCSTSQAKPHLNVFSFWNFAQQTPKGLPKTIHRSVNSDVLLCCCVWSKVLYSIVIFYFTIIELLF